MATIHVDARGMKGPVPVLTLTRMRLEGKVKDGDVVEILSDCPAFEHDLNEWCATWGRKLLRITHEGPLRRATVQL